MSKEQDSAENNPVRRLISLGKDLVALLRDSTIFILTLLLIVFPTKFNSILVAAGFEEGSFVGLKWKSNLEVTNEKLDEANEQITALQSKNDELVAALAEAQDKFTNENTESGGEFSRKVANLEEQSLALKSQTQIVQSSVNKRLKTNIDFINTKKNIQTKSDFFVGLQTVGVDDSRRIALNEQIQSEGYSLDDTTYAYPADQKPSWFAYRPTVFYYSTAAKGQATELAAFMKSKTGKTFHVQRGAGLGVDADKKDVTLFVHYING